VARYVIRATNDTGVVEFTDRLTIEAALQRATELGRAHFRHITIINVFTGVEITDLEALIAQQADSTVPSEEKGMADSFGQEGHS
jgi:hypothetical protein